jgi:hypothetical protein
MEEDKANNDNSLRGSKKFLSGFRRNSNNDIKKYIKMKIPINRQIKNNNELIAESNNNFKKENKEDININENGRNKIPKINNKNQMNIDSAGFNKLKNGIINKKDSIQISFMKYVSAIFVIITFCLVIYNKSFSINRYSKLVQYVKENIYFTHSKIISSCIYISSLNIKWLKYKYIDEESCPNNCTTFYKKILEECINDLKIGKDLFYSFDSDFKEITKIEEKIFIKKY